MSGHTKKICFCLWIFIDCCLMVWLVGLILFGMQIQNYVSDTTTKTDAIVVLTGGRNRVHEAIELFNKGMASKLFISGVPRDVHVAELVQKSSSALINENAIELGRRATTTVENAEEVAAWCRKNNVKSVRLVTSNYHIPRSMAELNNYDLDISFVIHPVYSEYVSAHWWKSWGTFRLIAMEYNKFLIVCVRNFFKRKK